MFLELKILLNRNSIRVLEQRLADLNVIILERAEKLRADGYLIALDRERFDHADRLAAGTLSLACTAPDATKY